MAKKELDLLVTLWPSFPHFLRSVGDERLAGIRLNSAMMSTAELTEELSIIESLHESIPLYYDIKGRQLRVTDTLENDTHLDIRINHPISVKTPTPVLFKAGADGGILERIEGDGRRLIFRIGRSPDNLVKPGESLHIRDKTLKVYGEQFTPVELEKIDMTKKAGFTRYFLSYVESGRDVDEFINLVGKEAEVMLKIENKAGLEYVGREFKKRPNLRLVAARGDLYVEVDRPHHILDALKLIIEKDPEANVGSRILLSTVTDPVPSCADFTELAWLYDIGYRSMMLCDELCLKGDLLARAVNAFQSFKETYIHDDHHTLVS